MNESSAGESDEGEYKASFDAQTASCGGMVLAVSCELNTPGFVLERTNPRTKQRTSGAAR